MTASRRSVREVSLPTECGIAHLFPTANLADAFAAILPRGASRDVDQLARNAFEHQPGWVHGLMAIRDAAVGTLGLKTAGELQRSRTDGRERIGIFRIYERRDQELILGEDDRHLDFRLSVLLRPSGSDGDDEIVVSTAVHCHNRLGRTYLAAIRPFHRLIVPSDLRAAARHGWPMAEGAPYIIPSARGTTNDSHGT